MYSTLREEGRVSIRGKLIRMQLLLAVIVLLFSSIGYIANDLFVLKNSIEGQLGATARILERNLASALAFADTAEVTKVLSSLSQEPEIAGAYLMDAQGKIIARYERFAIDEPEPLPADSIHFRGRFLLLTHSLMEGAEGHTLLLRSDLTVFLYRYAGFLAIAVLVFLGGLGISVIISQLTHRSLSTPIIELAKAASIVSSSGDYSIRISGRALENDVSEVIVLSKEFNRMLNQIEFRDQKVRLEKEVAENANRSKSIFLANISHELRTPMHGILSFARFGQQKIDSASKEKLKNYFDEIHESGSRLMTLLNDLLDLSKLEAGKMTYTMETGDLVQTLTSVKSEVNAFAQERDLNIELVSPSAAEAIFDSERLRQVIRNLVSNAIKFSKPQTTIRLALDLKGETVRIEVINIGVGIPDSELETIFDKFTQSSRTRTGAGGTGLGLAICREIVQQHSGRIWAESQSTGETRFILEMPKALTKTHNAA